MMWFDEIVQLQSEVDNIILNKINEKTREDNNLCSTRFGKLIDNTKDWSKSDFDFFTLDKRKIAFNVELGELANELGFFKYWKFNHSINRDRVKDEWADCLAFLVSLIISKNIVEHVKSNLENYSKENMMLGGSVEREFKGMMYNNLMTKQDYTTCLHELFWMMGSINYTFDELIEAYKVKTKENIRRAKDGY